MGKNKSPKQSGSVPLNTLPTFRDCDSQWRAIDNGDGTFRFWREQVKPLESMVPVDWTPSSNDIVWLLRHADSLTLWDLVKTIVEAVREYSQPPVLKHDQKLNRDQFEPIATSIAQGGNAHKDKLYYLYYLLTEHALNDKATVLGKIRERLIEAEKDRRPIRKASDTEVLIEITRLKESKGPPRWSWPEIARYCNVKFGRYDLTGPVCRGRYTRHRNVQTKSQHKA